MYNRKDIRWLQHPTQIRVSLTYPNNFDVFEVCHNCDAFAILVAVQLNLASTFPFTKNLSRFSAFVVDTCSDTWHAVILRERSFVHSHSTGENIISCLHRDMSTCFMHRARRGEKAKTLRLADSKICFLEGPNSNAKCFSRLSRIRYAR